MMPYPDEQLVAMIKSGDPDRREEALRQLYTEGDCYVRQQLVRYAKKNGGNQSDGQDLCHDAFIILDKAVREGKFNGKSNLKTYAVAIGKWQWWNRQRKSKPLLGLDPNGLRQVEKSVEDYLIAKENQDILDKAIESLGEEAAEMLSLWNEKTPIKTISEQLGHPNEKHTENRVYRSLEKLRGIVKKLQ